MAAKFKVTKKDGTEFQGAVEFCLDHVIPHLNIVGPPFTEPDQCVGDFPAHVLNYSRDIAAQIKVADIKNIKKIEAMG